MDHNEIAERNLVELYVLGRLDSAEEEHFEAHFANCAECQEQLEAAQDLALGLRATAARDIADAARYSFWLRLLAELRRPRTALLMVAVAALAVMPWFWLVLDQQKAVPPGPGKHAPEWIPTFALGVTRDTGSGSSMPLLKVPSGAPQVGLLLEPGGEHEKYRAELEKADGKVLWQGENLERGAGGFLLLSVPGQMLPVGEYLLRLEGKDGDGRGEPLGTFAFRVKRPGDP